MGAICGTPAAGTVTAPTDSKTACLAAERMVPASGSRLFRHFAQLRTVLRDASMRPGGAQSTPTNKKDPTKASIFFLDGEAHRSRRAAIIRYFTPKAA